MPAANDEADEPFESEGHFLEFLVSACTQRDMEVDFSDDCGLLNQPTRLVSTDTIIENVHFSLEFASPYQIGRQAAVVNLSDLAGSGGKPTWALLSLQLTDGWFGARLKQLCLGFLDELACYGVRLVGGNCAHADGPLSISVTVGGGLYGPEPITRSGAQVGDYLYVSGTLGASAVGLASPIPENLRLRHQWRPHLIESQQLCELQTVTAMMDVSDGLVTDADRLAKASNVAIHIELARLPLVPGIETKAAQNHALYGGEDYILLFTMPSTVAAPEWAYHIGHVRVGHGIQVDGSPPASIGFDHFEAGTRNRP